MPTMFIAKLLRPKQLPEGPAWAFVQLPRTISAQLPRRGRTTVEGSINGQPFTVLAEPDGRKGHWLRFDAPLLKASGAEIGSKARFRIAPAHEELEPAMPDDLVAALRAAPESLTTWQSTTTIARIDWIHWITSARQATTRARRIKTACAMLVAGKTRVCCFDPSGYYSKAFGVPQAEVPEGNPRRPQRRRQA